jgi:hypothetical protein
MFGNMATRGNLAKGKGERGIKMGNGRGFKVGSTVFNTNKLMGKATKALQNEEGGTISIS